MHVVDEPRSKEVADRCGASSDANVLAGCCLAGHGECFCRRRVDEVERRAAFHLDGWPRVVGEDESRSVERRVGPPPTVPAGVLVPSRRPELACPHYLGADSDVVTPREGVVDAARAARLSDHFSPPPGEEQPFVQALAGVPEWCLEAEAFAGTETV